MHPRIHSLLFGIRLQNKSTESTMNKLCRYIDMGYLLTNSIRDDDKCSGFIMNPDSSHWIRIHCSDLCWMYSNLKPINPDFLIDKFRNTSDHRQHIQHTHAPIYIYYIYTHSLTENIEMIMCVLLVIVLNVFVFRRENCYASTCIEYFHKISLCISHYFERHTVTEIDIKQHQQSIRI